MMAGVNGGWIDYLLRRREASWNLKKMEGDSVFNAEGIWDNIARLNWFGPRFERTMSEMLSLLASKEHRKFHKGLAILGRCLGALVTHTSAAGAPDNVWTFLANVHFAFEAKTEKKEGSKLSKRDLLQASGHCDWVKNQLAAQGDEQKISAIIIAPDKSVEDTGVPHIKGQFHLSQDQIIRLGEGTVSALRSIRTTYAGSEYFEATDAFEADLRVSKIDFDSISSYLTGTEVVAH